MEPQEVTVLDYIENISVPGNVFAEPANEYFMLLCHWHGMEFLYRQALSCENAAKAALGITANLRVSSSGNAPGLEKVPRTLLTTAFLWYSVSAFQYASLVAAIARQGNPERLLPREYVKGFMPEVLAFRDKFGAHHAFTTKNKADNDAERMFSVMPPVDFSNDSFYVGGKGLSARLDGEVSDTSAIQPWSLCRVHEKLRTRYRGESAAANDDSGQSK